MRFAGLRVGLTGLDRMPSSLTKRLDLLVSQFEGLTYDILETIGLRQGLCCGRVNSTHLWFLNIPPDGFCYTAHLPTLFVTCFSLLSDRNKGSEIFMKVLAKN